MSDTTGTLPRLATAAELAERWGEDPHTIYRWVREHGMPCVRIGRSMRFDTTAVSRWLDAGGTARNGDEGR